MQVNAFHDLYYPETLWSDELSLWGPSCSFFHCSVSGLFVHLLDLKQGDQATQLTWPGCWNPFNCPVFSSRIWGGPTGTTGWKQHLSLSVSGTLCLLPERSAPSHYNDTHLLTIGLGATMHCRWANATLLHWPILSCLLHHHPPTTRTRKIWRKWRVVSPPPWPRVSTIYPRICHL